MEGWGCRHVFAATKGKDGAELGLPAQVGALSATMERATLPLWHLAARCVRFSEVWDLSKCSPPAALAWTLTRMLWSAQQVRRRCRRPSRLVAQQGSESGVLLACQSLL